MKTVNIDINLTKIINNAKVRIYRRGGYAQATITLPISFIRQEGLENEDLLVLAYLGKSDKSEEEQ